MKFIATATACLIALPALISSAPTGEANAEKRQSFPTSITYDDQDSVVGYYGSWTHLQNQGFQLQSKTESYTGQANAEVHFPNPIGAGVSQTFKVTVFSTKKSDRGVFNVYCGHKLIGSGNEKSSGGETNSGIVFHTENALCEGGQDFVVKNDRGAKFLAIDAFKLEFNEP